MIDVEYSYVELVLVFKVFYGKGRTARFLGFL